MSRFLLLLSAQVVFVRAATIVGVSLSSHFNASAVRYIKIEPLLERIPKHHICAGAQIGHQWVLVAAHCAKNQGIITVQDLVGKPNRAKSGEEFHVPVETTIIHPARNGQDNDFGLLKLAGMGLPADYIIPLANANESVAEGTICLAISSGVEFLFKTRIKVRAVKVPYADQQECRESYANLNITPISTSHMICVGYPKGGRDTCQGDYGGPLICNGKLFGITSSRIRCFEKKFYGVYSSVPAARDWIHEVTGI